MLLLLAGFGLSSVKAGLPPAIEKVLEELVCKELEKGTAEDDVAKVVCGKLHEKLPFIPEGFGLCQAAVKKVWEGAEKKCAPMTQLPAPIKTMIHELVCKELESGTVEQDVAKAVCGRLHDKIKLVPEQLCEAEVKKVWDGEEKQCSPSELAQLPAPVKKIVHDMVCKELEKGVAEEVVVKGVCHAVHEKMKLIPEGLCEVEVKKVWDGAESKCKPTVLDAVELPAPIKGMIHELVCKELENGASEENVAKAVCNKIHLKIPFVPEELCEVAVKKAWDGEEKKCSPSQSSKLPAPVKKMIHDLVCKELENGTAEKDVVKAVCTKVHNKVSFLPEELCEMGVKKVWDGEEKKCSSTQLTKLPPFVKKMIHDLVCKELENGTAEQDVTKAVCGKVHNKIKLIPEELCEAGVKKVWSGEEKKCTPSEVVQLPAPIKKMIHDFVCKEIENGTTDKELAKAVCGKMHGLMTFLPEARCELAVEAVVAVEAKKCAVESLKKAILV